MASSNSSRSRVRTSARRTPYSLRSRPRGGETLTCPPDHTPTQHQADCMKCIIGRTWQLHSVSPLHHMSWAPSSIRSYSNQLSAQLLSFNGGGERGSWSVRVTSLPHFGMDGSHGLQIEISSRGKQKGGCVLSAILCSPTTPVQLDPSPASDEFTHLPVLLVRAPIRVTSLLLQWLQMTFDCTTTPLLPSSLHLSALMSHYASTVTGGAGKKMEVVYSFPEGVCKAGLSTLTVELPWHSLQTIQRRCEDMPAEEQRSAVMTFIAAKVSDVTHFKLDLLKVSRVSFPSCHLDSQGRVKFTSTEHILPILSFLLQ